MILVQFDVVCDGGCSKSALETNTFCFSAAEAKIAAEQQGWFSIDGKHICPACAERSWKRDQGEPEESIVRRRQVEGGTVATYERHRTRRAPQEGDVEIRAL